MDEYYAQPTLGVGRVGDKVYKRVEKQTSKWEPVPQQEIGMCGNVRPSWDIEKKEFVFVDNSFVPGYEGMYYVISSALLLYRLLCLFKCDVVSEGPDGYKCIWWITLRHKETGELLQFGEWKGAAGIWTKFHQESELPESYKEDILSLLNELVKPDCPHPYDGCVAGSVA